MTSITIRSPRQVAVPRGSTFGAWAFHQISQAIGRLVDASHARAPNRSLSTRVRDANQVRAYAQSVAATDPGFAGDLYAAADRHDMAD